MSELNIYNKCEASLLNVPDAELFLEDQDRAIEANLSLKESLLRVGSEREVKQVVSLHGDEFGVVDDVAGVAAGFE